MPGAHTARDVFTNTVDNVSKNNAGCELTRQKTAIQSQTTSQLQLTCTRHSCTQMSTKNCLQSLQNQTSGRTERRRSVETEQSHCTAIAQHQNCGINIWVSILERLNYHPLLTGPSCFRNDETNTNVFIHADDGLFGTRSEVLKLVELLSKQVLMRTIR